MLAGKVLFLFLPRWISHCLSLLLLIARRCNLAIVRSTTGQGTKRIGGAICQGWAECGARRSGGYLFRKLAAPKFLVYTNNSADPSSTGRTMRGVMCAETVVWIQV